jgi:NADPH-dependent ferric siderophore reductase
MSEALRVRREPPAFRRLAVARTDRRTPHLVRVTLTGAELAGFEPPLPAGSVRLLIPDAPGAELIVPVWNGNAFFHVDGRRPVIRTLTPLRHDPAVNELDVDIVLHGAAPLSDWAVDAQPGDPAAISGPGRGYTIDPNVSRYVLAGDESALPAIGQLLAALPPGAAVTVIAEVANADARVPLPDHPNADLRWVDRREGAAPGAALVEAVFGSSITREARVWAAGEAAAVQRIRRHVFGELGISRGQASVRGYWKHGRSGGDDDEA